MKTLRKVKPDAKGRILLGSLARGISSYSITEDHGRLILEPNVEIPAKEKWLWENKNILKQVKKGMDDSAANKLKSKGSFAKFVDDEE